MIKTPISLPPLPYHLSSLEPYISKETLKIHYGKHHAHYVETLNQLIKKTPYEKMGLEEIVVESFGKDGQDKKIYHNAAQAWNHEFYWNGLSRHSLRPSPFFIDIIERSFESMENFQYNFKKIVSEHFASGWAWLIKDETEMLSFYSTDNADTPIANGHQPLLTCDLWEHAYYLDYKNEREKYFDRFWKIINWEFVEANYQKSQAHLFKPSRMGTGKTLGKTH